MGWPKYHVGTIKVIRFVELVSFLTAFLILCAFFAKIESYKVTIAVIVFFVSLMVIKTDLLFYYSNNAKEIISNWLETGKILIVGIKKLLGIFFKLLKSRKLFLKLKAFFHEIPRQSLRFLKYICVIFKQIFFNVCYDIFPILLIWLSVSGFIVIFNITSIPGLKDNLNPILAFGILLGIFQYFLKRHEEKIFPKISTVPKRINAIIAEETDFSNFFDSLEKSLLKDDIKKVIDPKLTALDFVIAAYNEPELKPLFRNWNKKKSPIPIQPVINYHYNSDQQYQLAEMKAKETDQEKELYNAYLDFFTVTANKEINNRIKCEVDIDEFAILAQSNINIIQEVIPQFINLNLQKEFDKITDDSVLIALPTEPSATEFKEYLEKLIYSEIWSKILP